MSHHHTEAGDVAVARLTQPATAFARLALLTELGTNALVGTCRAPGSEPTGYASQLLRDVKRGHAKPVAMTLALLLDAIDRGAKRSEAEALPRFLLAVIAARYPAPARRPLDVLHRVETKLDGAVDLAQMRERTERSPASRRALIEALAAYAPVLDELREALEHDQVAPLAGAGDLAA